MATEPQSSTRVAFLHPDLGLGGAERLVVDAAAGLAELGYHVDIFTAYHDPSRCFKETVDGSFGVYRAGNWFPRNVLGKAHAFCAYIRCILVSFYLAWHCSRQKTQYKVIIVDQVSATIPFLHWLTASKILFYCHHPDLLLAQRRPGLHKIYRLPIDWLEECTTGQADQVVANSKYTAEIYEHTFPRLHRRSVRPGILYPACNVPSTSDLTAAQQTWRAALPQDLVQFLRDSPLLLSINRFERKKDIGLAIKALAELLRASNQTAIGLRPKLVAAGGYDKRLAENREHLAELQHLAAELGVEDSVYFLPSFTDQQRSLLLAACSAVLYTPVNEHFGIVPLEAMAAERPVVACNSGGPVESIIHGRTGFLCEPTPQSFAAAIKMILAGGRENRDLGENARKHVLRNFSRPAFGARLDDIIQTLIGS